MNMLNRMTKRRRLMLVLAGGLALQASGTALARCWEYESQFELRTHNATVAANGASNGRPVGGWRPSHIGGYGVVGCTEGRTNYFEVTGTEPDVGTYDPDRSRSYSIYETGIDGLGMIVAMRIEGVNAPRDYIPIRTGATNKVQGSTDSWPQVDIRISFVKYGDVAAGTYTTKDVNLGTIRVYDTSFIGTGEIPLLLAGATVEVVRRPVCNVESKSVYMGLSPATGFTGKYSAGRKQGFYVYTNCEAKSGTVNYILEGTDVSPVVDAARGIVEVSGGAEGVGLQMLDAGDRPIPFNESHYLGSVGDDEERLPKYFQAQYVQVVDDADDIVPGEANASVRMVVDFP